MDIELLVGLLRDKGAYPVRLLPLYVIAEASWLEGKYHSVRGGYKSSARFKSFFCKIYFDVAEEINRFSTRFFDGFWE